MLGLLKENQLKHRQLEEREGHTRVAKINLK